MATRFYFENFASNASLQPAFDGNWGFDRTLGVSNLIEKTKADVTAQKALSDNAWTETSGTTGNAVFFRLLSEPIPPQRFIGTVSLVVRCSEAALTANASLALIVRVLSQDATVIRGTLFSNLNLDTEYAVTAATRIASAQAITELTTQPGDRLCVEIGTHIAASTTSQSVVMRAGYSAASDFALTSGLTTDLNPWIEFSQNIWSSDTNNYQFVRVGSGMSTSEKIR